MLMPYIGRQEEAEERTWEVSNAEKPLETGVDALKQCVEWLEHHKARLHHPICTYHKPDARCSCGLHRVLTNLRGVICDMETDAEKGRAK